MFNFELYAYTFRLIFEKSNEETMEQVLHCLLPLVNLVCFKSKPWPITALNEAAEFRYAATLVINVSLKC